MRKVTGMLIDPSTFNNDEIIEMIFNDNLLKEYANEAEQKII